MTTHHRPGRQWDSYWAYGRLTSLPHEFSGNYTGPVAEYWTKQFAGLENGARVLDLCAGNGAVALLAIEWARQQDLTIEVHAVDASRIDPAAAARAFPGQQDLLSAIHFHPGQPVENLDFQSASFDLLTSQYGIEYCEWPKAAAEVVRVLRPGGHFVMLCHSTSSDIFPHMRLVEQQYQILDSLEFLPSIKAFLQRKLGFQTFRRLLRRTRQEVMQLQASQGSAFLASVRGMLDETVGQDKAGLRRDKQRLKQFYLELTGARARQADMLKVHQRLSTQADWYTIFCDMGLKLEQQGSIAYPARSGRRTNHAGDFYRFSRPLDQDGSGPEIPESAGL